MGRRSGYTKVSMTLRRRVMRRDGGRCVLCGKPGTEVDHIVNDAEGGATVLSNLRLLCAECHAVKSKQEAARGLREMHSLGRLPRERHPLDN